MRRRDKEITDRELLDAIINQAEICHLACSWNNQPYVVPLSFGYDGQSVYLHTAPSGQKNEILKSNPQVCLGFESGVKLLADPDQACHWSFIFSSVIATGNAEEITLSTQKEAALNQIMLHYSGRSWDFPKDRLSNTILWQVELITVTGKKSQENSD